MKSRFGQLEKSPDTCRKIRRMKQKFSNIIKGDGKSIIMLYGEVGEGRSVDSNRVVSELFALSDQGCKIEVRINSRVEMFSAAWPSTTPSDNPRKTSPYI